MKKSKSSKRTEFMYKVMEALKHPDIYNIIDYNNMAESVIKAYIHPHLIRELSYYHMDIYNSTRISAEEYAHKALLWEGDKRKTVNNVKSFGVMHRPDMVIETKDFNIAIEIKKGDNGQAIREGIGQSFIYSTVYDFVTYLFIDTSEDKRILKSITLPKESDLIVSLWSGYNIWLGVI